MVYGSVVSGGVTLSEVVGFNLSGISSKPFPINLVKIIGLHHETADNTGTVGCLHLNSDFSEEDVEVTGDGRGLSLLLHDETRSICGIVGQTGTCCFGEIVA